MHARNKRLEDCELNLRKKAKPMGLLATDYFKRIFKKVRHHTDAGVLTVLLQDDHVNSLNVFFNNEWISVPPKKDTFVINIGDMMQVKPILKCLY